MDAATADLQLETWSTKEDIGQPVTLELRATVAMMRSYDPSLDTVSILVKVIQSTPQHLLILLILKFGWQYSCH